MHNIAPCNDKLCNLERSLQPLKGRKRKGTRHRDEGLQERNRCGICVRLRNIRKPKRIGNENEK